VYAEAMPHRSVALRVFFVALLPIAMGACSNTSKDPMVFCGGKVVAECAPGFLCGAPCDLDASVTSCANIRPPGSIPSGLLGGPGSCDRSASCVVLGEAGTQAAWLCDFP
jgi:hypothetical protein